jgi:hypothetical protein
VLVVTYSIHIEACIYVYLADQRDTGGWSAALRGGYSMGTWVLGPRRANPTPFRVRSECDAASLLVGLVFVGGRKAERPYQL